MKKLALLFTALLISAPAHAGGPVFIGNKQRTVYYEDNCFKKVETYVPGRYDKWGNWRSGRVDVVTKRVPCGRRYNNYNQPHIHHDHPPNVGKVDDNSCVEGSVLGGIAGGGLGAALSRGDGRLWAIPLGVVGGALAGCQVDGG